MDKEAIRVRSGQNRNISEQNTNTSKNNHWNNKWASNSKFNRILNNIERSIISQFTGSGNNNNNNNNTNISSGSSNKINGKSNHSNVKQSANNHKLKPPSQTHHLHNHHSLITNVLKSNQNKKSSEQKDSHQIAAKLTNRITLQPKNNSATNSSSLNSSTELTTTSGGGGSKNGGNRTTTLNKYQQQIVSTMRSNPLLVNNKLSIPPPHANDEARNQNHRILFGASVNHQTFDTNNSDFILNNAHANNSSNKLRTSVEIDPSKVQSKLDNNIRQQDSLRPNSSPASSARSLPTLTTKSSGSQQSSSYISNRIVATAAATTTSTTSKDDEEESGFTNYRSRRSLVSTTRSVQDYPSNTEPSSHQQQNKPNNMIPMQMNQVPINAHPLSFNQHLCKSTNLIPYQQDSHHIKWQPTTQAINSQNYLHPQHHHNQQQIVGGGNQVPILTTDTGNNTRYTNNPHHQFTNGNNNSQKFNQFSDQQQQLYVLYCPTSFAIVPINSVDNGQQIYANAPPKPRRYQYYDSYQTHSIPHTVTSSAHSTSTTLQQPPPPVITVSDGNPLICHPQQQQQQQQQPQSHMFSHHDYRQSLSHIHQQQMQQQQQQQQQRIKSLQPSYNISYMQLQNAHQNLGIKNHQDSLMNQAGQSMHYNGSYLHPQQQQPNIQPLTKSKSNLDAADLMKFKLDRLSFNQAPRANTLHIQSNRQPIYCSQLDINHRFPDLAQQTTPYNFPQASSNLQRSKSVSHLVPEYDHHQHQQQQQQQQSQNNLFVESLSTAERKLPSVSSASTTNLNYVGLSGQQFEPNTRVYSQLNISQKHCLDHSLERQQQQQQQQQQHQNNRPMFSASSTLRHYPLNRINNCTTNLHQVQPSMSQFNRDLNQQSHHHYSTQTRNNMPTNSNNISNNVNIIRQSQLTGNNDNSNTKHDDSFNKPSLDDKIRQLLISSKDNEVANNRIGDSNNLISVVGGTASNNNSTRNIDNNVIYQPHTSNNISSRITHMLQPSRHQQAPDAMSADRLLNNALALHEDGIINESLNEQQRSFRSMQKSTSIGQLTNIHISNQQNNFSNSNNNNNHSNINEVDSNHLTNRIYVNESIQKMGNKQHGHYQLKINNNNLQLESPRKYQQVVADESSHSLKPNELQNSQLIVDLTTPRVLAKTQTTLLPTTATTNNNNSNQQQQNTNWSINQVGLPQPTVTQQQNGNISKQLNNLPVLVDKTNQDTTTTTTNKFSNDFSLNKDNNKAQILERSAPYYYSDLKSEEQRKALLSIVQQKSLSPPPKLLSRSTDQSSTRLALKSATFQPTSIINNNDNCLTKTMQDKQNDSITSNGNGFMREDEDFIEFLSSGSSSHRSQFEASQFSASDLNTSTTASVESSTSGACNDSLNSVPVTNSPTRHLFSNGISSKASVTGTQTATTTATTPTTTTTMGILKNGSINKNDLVVNNNNNNHGNNNKVSNDNTHNKSDISGNKNVDRVKDFRQTLSDNKNDEANEEKISSHFNNVLGNVIDVDICSVNNLSQCSPVNNQACLN